MEPPERGVGPESPTLENRVVPPPVAVTPPGVGDEHGDAGAIAESLRVVFAAASTQSTALRSCLNLLNAAESPALVEVVCFGGGVDFALAGGPSVDAVTELLARGVRVLVCRNSLDGRGLDESALIPEVGIVSAAVLHLAVRQHEGWSYLSV
jgi:intracellular sulfur oxidation DsrE/DsrF family protein